MTEKTIDAYHQEQVRQSYLIERWCGVKRKIAGLLCRIGDRLLEDGVLDDDKGDLHDKPFNELRK